MITSIASIKKRPKPDSVSHDSVGTEEDIKRRIEMRNSLEAFHLTREHLKPYIMSEGDMRNRGYVQEVPDSAGGSKPSEEGGVKECERCHKQFVVKKLADMEECQFHWGRAFMNRVNGQLSLHIPTHRITDG